MSKLNEFSYLFRIFIYRGDKKFITSGNGCGDFLPRANAGNRPAMIVELKHNQTADAAITQIKEKRYHGALSEYKGKILLVGINYDTEKHHTCVIEEY